MASNPITPGIGLAGIAINDAESKVFDILGQPTNRVDKVDSYTNALMYKYDGIFLGIYTYISKKIVRKIRLYDSNFNTSGFIPPVQGVKIGDTELQLIQAFGKPDKKEEHETCPNSLENTLAFTYTYSGISFWVCEANNLVYLIDIP